MEIILLSFYLTTTILFLTIVLFFRATTIKDSLFQYELDE